MLRTSLVGLLLVCVVGFQCGGDPLRRYRGDLRSDEPARKIEAMKKLGAARDRESVLAIILMLEDEEPGVRIQAARTLGMIGDSQAAAPLAEFCRREESAEAVEAGFRGLKGLGMSATDVVLRLLDSRRAGLRVGAAEVLGDLRASSAVDALIWRIDDGSPEVRAASISALRRIGAARGLEAIARRVGDLDDGVQGEAEDALGGPGYQDDLDRAKRLIRRLPGR